MSLVRRPRLGPLSFRLPFSPADRLSLLASPPALSSGRIGWPFDALIVSGILPGVIASPVRVRPIFPGSMSFLAEDPTQIPTLDQIDVVNGRVTDACLDRLNLVGMLRVRVQSEDHLTEMRKQGAWDVVGESPTHAFYGPVQLGSDFLRQALLDHAHGMLAAYFYPGHRVDPGDPEWEKLALLGFLAGSYEPILRAGKTLDDDDAGRLPMPTLRVEADRTYSLGIAVGWIRDPAVQPAAPDVAGFEVIPTLPFLRQVGTLVREEVLASKGADHIVQAFFEDEDSAAPSTERFRRRLGALGFGALDGSSLTEDIVREFQIAAAKPGTAVARPLTSPAELAVRDFHDLLAEDNLLPYPGPASGRANMETRVAIGSWEAGGFRNPLLIVAYHRDDLDPDERPLPGTIPRHFDLWSRNETTNNALRMFRASFAGRPKGTGLNEDDLEYLGYYAPFQTVGGPGSLQPTIASRRFSSAEILPDRMVGLGEDVLITALSKPGDPHLPDASTFKVVRAAAEQECLGYLDQVNAYDNAGISMGTCHWAMAGAIRNPEGSVELGGFAAYVQFLASQGALTEFFRPQGLSVVLGPGQSLRKVARQSSEARPWAPLGFLDDRGNPRVMSKNGQGARDTMPSWRSFSRWVGIGRSDPYFGFACWNMTLRRIASLLETPVAMSPLPRDERFAAGETRTIGSICTSELNVALLLRWHIKIPSALVTGSKTPFASDYFCNAYAAAAATRPASDDLWEEAMLAAIKAQLALFIAATGTAHRDLTNQFRDIERPSWVDETTNPPTPRNNRFGFLLDPRLRLVARQGGSFHLAPPAVEP